MYGRSIREDSAEFDNVDDLEEDEEPLVIDQEQWQGLDNNVQLCNIQNCGKGNIDAFHICMRICQNVVIQKLF